MAKVAGYIEQRRAGFEAVVDVPPNLRGAVGRKRLRKGLGTRDVHVARSRLPRALLELHARIDAARRRTPESDPVTAEALEMRRSLIDVRAGRLDGWAVAPQWHEINGEDIEITPREIAEDLLRDTIADRAEAIERAEGRERAAAFGDIALGRATPLALHIEDWLAEPGQKGAYRGRTLADYRRIVTGFGAWLGERGHAVVVERVTRLIAGRYLGALHGSGLGPARIRTVVAALSGYWQWMERRGVVGEGSNNPWSRQAPAKGKAVTHQEPERSFTDNEVAALLAGTADVTMSDLMRLAALSGLRIEEACRLKVGMCAEEVFTAPGTKTEAAKRAVPIHSDLAGIVARRCNAKPAGAYLFPELGDPNRYGDRSPAISKRFNRYRATIGVHEKEEGRRRSRVNFHSFRRYFITKALQAGQPARVVQQVVGHKLQGVTEGVYFGGDTIEAKRACVEAVKLPRSAPCL